MNSSSAITVAKTGRRTDRSEIIIGLTRSLPHAGRHRGIRFVRGAGPGFRVRVGCDLGGAHRNSVAHLLGSLDDDLFSSLETREHLDGARTARTDAHFAPLRLAVEDHE